MLCHLTAILACLCCAPARADSPGEMKTRIIVDSDANNELDDQHAIAYVLLNHDRFDVEGITVNRTFEGGSIRQHAEEAERVVRLCGMSPAVHVYEGATGDFEKIRSTVNQPSFDGEAAVNFIIGRAKASGKGKLVILAIGKLTNVGLALCKEPSIAPNLRIVWLGTNYPDSGEYNFENDRPVANYMLGLDVQFEIATVRYGKSSGTAAVQASVDEIRTHMRGKGPRISEPVSGRHGGEFSCFGDYSISLFEHVKEMTRSLYDMAAAAIVKNPGWAHHTLIAAPRFEEGRWVDQPDNPRKVIIWEDFDTAGIMHDFYQTFDR